VRLHRSGDWRVLVERHVGAADVVIVVDVVGQHRAQVLLVQDDDMVQTFSAECAVGSFTDGIFAWVNAERLACPPGPGA